MGLINSQIFQARPFRSADLNNCNGELKLVGNTPLLYMSIRRIVDGNDPELTVNIMYCHGNSMDIINSGAGFTDTMQSCIQNTTAPFSIAYNIYIWEYPTYTINKQTDLSPSTMCSNSKEVWENLIATYDTKKTINVCIGSSIGSAFASCLCSDPKMHILLLHAPFSQIPHGTKYWAAGMLMYPLYDNIEELKKKHPALYCCMICSKSDDVLLYAETMKLAPYMNDIVTYGNVIDYPHKYFFNKIGFSDLGRTLAKCIERSDIYSIMLDTYEQEDANLVGDSTRNIETITNTVKEDPQ